MAFPVLLRSAAAEAVAVMLNGIIKQTFNHS